VLTGKGVIAWQRALAAAISSPPARPAHGPAPAALHPLAAELIDILAALALGGP
jgi:hypothetical protein